MRRMIIPAALAAPLLAFALGFALPVVVHAGSNGCTITGTPGNDVLHGTAG